MHITDDSDKVIKVEYDPLIDTEVDFDAPYIDWEYVNDKELIELPESGIYDTLYFEDTPILVVGGVHEFEIRFYSTENPNENYRTGQRHIKGRIVDIQKNVDTDYDEDGYMIKVDTSDEYNGKISTININREYINTVNARCFTVQYFNEYGRVVDELTVLISNWLSPRVYLNSAFVVTDEEECPYKVGDLVDCVYYIKQKLKVDKDDNTVVSEGALWHDSNYEIICENVLGRLADIELTKKVYTNEQNIATDIYYYRITIDASTKYNYDLRYLSDNVIKSMCIHNVIEDNT